MTKLAAMLLTVLVAASPGRAAAQDVSSVLARAGIRSIQPPSQAPEFTLQDLDGQEVSLADFEGKWVLLTFWATWCGPCLYEMPSIQRLWEANQGGEFAVVAVAIGSDPGGVKDVAAKNGITFPMLVDRGGLVGTRYKAFSVPLSYIVDPRGRLVGIVRGAKDWSSVGTLVEDLVAADLSADPSREILVAPPVPAPSPGARVIERVQLPPDLEPPTVSVALVEGPVTAGAPFELQVAVSWLDTGEDYRIHPPRVELPAGVEESATSVSSSSLEGEKVLTYTVELVAAEPGEYSLDPVEVRFSMDDTAEPATTRVKGPTVMVGEDRRKIRRWRIRVALLSVVLVGVVAAGLLTYRQRTRTRAD